MTEARSKQEFLLRPDLGRSLSAGARGEIRRQGLTSIDVQVVIGDGLSAEAVVAQVPAALALAARRGDRSRLDLGPAVFHPPLPGWCA